MGRLIRSNCPTEDRQTVFSKWPRSRNIKNAAFLIKLHSWLFLENGPFENTAEGHLLTKVAVSYIRQIAHDHPIISKPGGAYYMIEITLGYAGCSLVGPHTQSSKRQWQVNQCMLLPTWGEGSPLPTWGEGSGKPNGGSHTEKTIKLNTKEIAIANKWNYLLLQKEKLLSPLHFRRHFIE